MRSLEMVGVAMAVIGLMAIFIGIKLRHATPLVAPYIEYAGLLSLAIGFFAITNMFLPFTWMICSDAAAFLLSHAFFQAFFKLRDAGNWEEGIIFN
ncbi:hypothetical protein ACSBR2_011758 [Camellia fascicularis]